MADLADHIYTVLPELSDREFNRLTKRLRRLSVDTVEDLLERVEPGDLQDCLEERQIRKLLKKQQKSGKQQQQKRQHDKAVHFDDRRPAVAAVELKPQTTTSKTRPATTSTKSRRAPLHTSDDERDEARGDSNAEPRELTILLLGELGAGKSTLINRVVAGLQYKSLYQALEDSAAAAIQLPVPVRLLTDKGPIYTDDEDDNEDYDRRDSGESVTRNPMTYRVEVPDQRVVFNVIDTPGIRADVPAEETGSFVDGLLKIICRYETLDAICVAMATGEKPRVAESLVGCIAQLLDRLKISASRANLLFCITRAERVHLDPPRVISALRSAFARNRKLKDSTITDDRVFCFDNSIVELLAGHQLGVRYEDVRDVEFDDAGVVREFVRRIVGFVPHVLVDWRAITEASRAIELVSEPLLQIVKLLGPNLRELRRARHKIQSDDGRALLHEYRVEFEELERPAVICSAGERCVKVSGGCVEYARRCEVRERPPLTMMSCAAMDARGKCRRCGCGSWKHRWVTCLPTVTRMRSVLDKAEIEDTIAEMKEARGELVEICATLSVFQRPAAGRRGKADAARAVGLDPGDDVIGERFRTEIKTLTSSGRDDETFEIAQELEKFFDEFSRKADSELEKQGGKMRPTDVWEAINDQLFMVSCAVGSQVKDAFDLIRRATRKAARQQHRKFSIDVWFKLNGGRDKQREQHNRRRNN